MKRKNSSISEGWYLIPIISLLGILPLIMKYYNFDTHLSGFSWYGFDSISVDLFNYYKHVFFIGICVVMSGILIGGLVLENGWKTLGSQRLFLALAVYGILVLLSTAGSSYRWFTLNGLLGHFETVYVLLGYCLTVLYCFYFVRKEEDVIYLIKGWCIFLIPMVLLGFSQLLGHDFYGTSLGRSLILTQEAKAAGSQIQLNFGIGRVYLSLYNPNYVGSFCLLAFPILITTGIFIKDIMIKTGCILLSAGIIMCLFGSLAKTAFIILPAALVFLIVFLRKDIKKYGKLFMAGAACLILLFITSEMINDGKITEGLKNRFFIEKETSPLVQLETQKDAVKVLYKGNELYIRSKLNDDGMMGFLLEDRDSVSIPVTLGRDESNEPIFKINDKRFSDIGLIPVQTGNFPGFSVRIDGQDWLFSNYTSFQGYYHYTPYGKFTRIETPPSFGFKGYGRLATNRGYIWSRTLPLLKDRILIGSGPDTFLFQFPQYDYVGRNHYLNGELLSKPHNIYLQIAVQTGVLSLVAYVTFYLMYFISSIRLYWNHASDSFISRIGTSILAATAGYMAVGFTTDSSINVAPVFWCFMGIGLAVNRIVRSQSGHGLATAHPGKKERAHKRK